MKSFSLPLIKYSFILALTSGLAMGTGCMDMYDQPSYKAQEGPRISPPKGSIAIARDNSRELEKKFSKKSDRDKYSFQRGKELFAINCSMCHGKLGLGDGLVGKKFSPPHPPNLYNNKIKNYSPAKIYQVITNGFGRMPPFKIRLNDKERLLIANFLKKFNPKK